MTTRYMQRLLLELYGVEVSPELIADEVLDECESWRRRPLESSHAIVYLDAIRVKIRDSGTVDLRAVYLAVGIDHQGIKSVFGMWIGEREGAKFWLSVLSDLKARGYRTSSSRS